jgi:hypothetical protein
VSLGSLLSMFCNCTPAGAFKAVEGRQRSMGMEDGR